MLPPSSSLRCFIPSKDFNRSREFYRLLGFQETWSNDSLAVFSFHTFSFYLQNFYVEELANNYMMFLEVPDADKWWFYLQGLNVTDNFPEVKLKAPQNYEWGIREIHLIDPSGVLWHIGQFLH